MRTHADISKIDLAGGELTWTMFTIFFFRPRHPQMYHPGHKMAWGTLCPTP